MIKTMILAAAALTMSGTMANAQTMIEKNNIKVENHLMTPEALWAMGRIGGAEASPNGKQIVYQVGYYSVKENKGHQMLFIMDANGKNQKALTTDAKSESDATWIADGKKIAFIRNGQLWSMNPDGTDRKQLTHDKEGYPHQGTALPRHHQGKSIRPSPGYRPTRYRYELSPLGPLRGEHPSSFCS